MSGHKNEVPFSRGKHKGFWLVNSNREPEKDPLEPEKDLESSVEPSFANYIKSEFPGKRFQVRCKGDDMEIAFEFPLTEKEKTKLNECVLLHQKAEQSRVDLEYDDEGKKRKLVKPK